MIRIGIRELRQNASRYIEQVKSGETVEVTERGRLVALLVAPDSTMLERDRLIQAGKIIPATATYEYVPPLALAPGSPSLSETLGEMRQERLP